MGNLLTTNTTNNELTTTNNELTKIKGELTTTNNELTKIKGELITTNNELITTNNELTKIKGAFTTTNNELTKIKGELTKTKSEFTIEEQSEFTVMLSDYGTNKVGVIKAVREITGLGLKEAKDLVDTCPNPVKEKINKADASAYIKKLQDAGAKAEIK